MNLASSFGSPLNHYTGTTSVTNLGTLNLSVAGGHAIDNGVVFVNGGTVNVEAGTLIIRGGGSDGGVYSVASGAALNLAAGTRTLLAGSQVSGGGTLLVSGGTVHANGVLGIAGTGAALRVTGGVLNVNGDAVSGLLAPVTVSGGDLNFNTTSAVSLPSLVLTGGSVGGAAAVTVTGVFEVSGSYATLAGTGVFTTQGVSTVNMSAGVVYLALTGGKTWVNEGTLTIGGDDHLYFGVSSGGSNQLVNAAGATLNLASTNGTPLNHYTGTSSVTNLGTINATAAGSHAFEGPVGFSNAGTVNVEAGTLILRGGGSDARGRTAVASGTVLNFAGGTRDVAGRLAGHGGGHVAGLRCHGERRGCARDLGADGGGQRRGDELQHHSAVSLPSLVLTGGSVGGAAAVTVTGVFEVSGSYATLAGTGVFTTQGVSTVNMSAGVVYLALTGGKTWVNEGTLTIGGDDHLYFGVSSGGSNQLVNAAGATLNLASTNGTPLNHYTGTSSVTNLGTINATAAGSHAFEGPVGFSNAGTVNVEAGTLILRGGGSDAGAYAVASGTVLNFAGGTRDMLDGSQVTGAGTLLVSGATVNVEGVPAISVPTVAVSNGAMNFNTTSAVSLPSLVLTGGSVGGAAAVTVTGVFEVSGSYATLAGTGVFTTQGVSTVNMSAGVVYLALTGGKTWVNQGTLTIGGDDHLYFGVSSGGSNQLVNAAGATLNLASTNGTPLNHYTGTSSVTNLGTINATAPGNHDIHGSIAFTNSGALTIEAGTLRYNRAWDNQGVLSIAPGASMTVGGAFTNGTQAEVRIGIGNATTTGVLAVSGTVTLAGTLAVYLDGGYVPEPGSVFDVITYTSRTGDFAVLRGESPGGQMTFAVDTATDPRVLKVTDIVVTTVLPGVDLVVTDLEVHRLAGAVRWQHHHPVARPQHRHAGDDDVVDRPAGAAQPRHRRGTGRRPPPVRRHGQRAGRGRWVGRPRGDHPAARRQSWGRCHERVGHHRRLQRRARDERAGDVRAEQQRPAGLRLRAGAVPGPRGHRPLADPGGRVARRRPRHGVVDDPQPGQRRHDRLLDRDAAHPQPHHRTDALHAGSAVRRHHARRPRGRRHERPQRERDLAARGRRASGGSSSPSPPTPAGRCSSTTRRARPRRTTRCRRSSCRPPTSSVVDLATSTPTPQSGELITITWADTNLGTAAVAGGWFDRIRVVNLTTNTVLVNQQLAYVPEPGEALQPGGTVPRSLLLPAARRHSRRRRPADPGDDRPEHLRHGCGDRGERRGHGGDQQHRRPGPHLHPRRPTRTWSSRTSP